MSIGPKPAQSISSCRLGAISAASWAAKPLRNACANVQRGCPDMAGFSPDFEFFGHQRPIGERSDAVLQTAIGARSDAVLRTAMGRQRRRRARLLHFNSMIER